MEYAFYKKEIIIEADNKKIYGIAFIPEVNDKRPLTIMSHGLGGSYSDDLEYAIEYAKRGIVAYVFDFRGGGGDMSDPDTTKMSIMTEVDDLNMVIDYFKDLEFIDSEKIILQGESQGGFVSAICASRRDDIMALILLYPAFNIVDFTRRQFKSLDKVPDRYEFVWITLGRKYAEDIWDYDAYDETRNYKGKVLIIQGTDDNLVPMSDSKKVLNVYEDARFKVIEGARHGFRGSHFNEAIAYIEEFLKEMEI